MKNIKIIGCGIIICCVVVALLLAIFEFLVWRMHDYAPNYATIQFCIENGGAWDDDQENCNGA